MYSKCINLEESTFQSLLSWFLSREILVFKGTKGLDRKRSALDSLEPCLKEKQTKVLACPNGRIDQWAELPVQPAGLKACLHLYCLKATGTAVIWHESSNAFTRLFPFIKIGLFQSPIWFSKNFLKFLKSKISVLKVFLFFKNILYINLHSLWKTLFNQR
jgi:hypothetical protein